MVFNKFKNLIYCYNTPLVINRSKKGMQCSFSNSIVKLMLGLRSFRYDRKALANLTLP